MDSGKKIRIIRASGDITKINCDAIMTAINAGRAWFGGIDRAIYSVAGGLFHDQIRDEELYELNTIVTKGNGTTRFENVIFVVDELEYPLRSVIASGLQAAHIEGFKFIAIPSIRTGVMKGKVEREYGDVVNEYIEGVKLYLNSVERPNIHAIVFVAYNNPELEEVLRNAIKNEGW